ncbi:MAG: hypothetical protein QOH05_1233 [Acetobacteraceae bacterium]|nr:hypothetical protein [Acetobacteraceae bacterium]
MGLRVVVLVALSVPALTASSGAQTRIVSGQSGILGEWELTATVTKETDGGGRRWRGPLSLKHIGFCSVDGPEEKTGELRLDVSARPDEARATLVIDGITCTFTGHLADGYNGVMMCPDRPGLPMMLSFE